MPPLWLRRCYPSLPTKNRQLLLDGWQGGIIPAQQHDCDVDVGVMVPAMRSEAECDLLDL